MNYEDEQVFALVPLPLIEHPTIYPFYLLFSAPTWIDSIETSVECNVPASATNLFNTYFAGSRLCQSACSSVGGCPFPRETSQQKIACSHLRKMLSNLAPGPAEGTLTAAEVATRPYVDGGSSGPV